MPMLPKTCPVCLQNSLDLDYGYISCKNCSVYRVRAKWWQVIYSWTLGKYWWARLPVYVWMAYTISLYLGDSEFIGYRLANPINAIDFGMHELGHFLFIPLGQFMTIAGGSLMQILFPLAWAGIAVYKRWYFAAGLCVVWMGLSGIDVSIYAADAQVRLLPLVSLGGDYDSAHDWYQMLSRLDMLEQTNQVASAIRLSSIVAIVVGMAWSGVLMLSMFIDSMRRLFTQTSDGVNKVH